MADVSAHDTKSYTNQDRRTCVACRQAKVKCDRVHPTCGRCHRLQMPCVEQVRRQGRPSAPPHRSLSNSTSNNTSDLHPNSSSSSNNNESTSSSSTNNNSKKPRQPQQQPQPPQEQPRHVYQTAMGQQPHRPSTYPDYPRPPPQQPQPAAALMQHHQHYQTDRMDVVSELITHAFARLVERRAIDLRQTGQLLYHLSLLSACWQHDFSLGLVTKALHILVRSLGSLRDHPEVVASELAFMKQDLNVRVNGPQTSFGVTPPLLGSMDDRVSALIHTVSIQGAACQVNCNQQFSDMFFTPEEFYVNMHHEGICPILMFIRLISAEDRMDFVETVTGHMFGQSKELEVAQVVRVMDRFESSFLAMVRLRQLVLAGGVYVSYMMSISPMPTTKYLQHGASSWMGGLNPTEARFKNRHILGGTASSLTFTYNNLDLGPVRTWLSADDQQRDQQLGGPSSSRGGLESSMGGPSMPPAAPPNGSGQVANGYHDHPYGTSYADMDDVDTISYARSTSSGSMGTRPYSSSTYGGGHRDQPKLSRFGVQEPSDYIKQYYQPPRGGPEDDMEEGGGGGGWPQPTNRRGPKAPPPDGESSTYPMPPGPRSTIPSRPAPPSRSSSSSPSTSSSSSSAAAPGKNHNHHHHHHNHSMESPPRAQKPSFNPTEDEQLAVASIQLLRQSFAPFRKDIAKTEPSAAAPWEVAHRGHHKDEEYTYGHSEEREEEECEEAARRHKQQRDFTKMDMGSFGKKRFSSLCGGPMGCEGEPSSKAIRMD